MKKAFAFLAIFTIISPVFAATRYVTTQTPVNPAYYNNYYNNTNMMPVNNSNNKFRNIIDTVTSNFFGCPTGMTPPINPYASYGPNNYGRYQDYYDRHGWSRHNENIGNGAGIHILD